MTPNQQDPRHIALFALHLANFPVNTIDDSFLEKPADIGFDVTFDLEHGRQFSLGWDEEDRQWNIVGQFTPVGSFEQAAVQALAMNAILPSNIRWHAVNTLLSLAVRTEYAPTDDADIETLAMHIVDVLLWLHKTADSEATLSSRDNSKMDNQTFV